MLNANLIGAPTTGQTAIFMDELQPWAKQSFDCRDIECYCLDAPEWVPTGETRHVPFGLTPMGQASFRSREVRA